MAQLLYRLVNFKNYLLKTLKNKYVQNIITRFTYSSDHFWSIEKEDVAKADY